MSEEATLSWLCVCFRLNRLIARVRIPGLGFLGARIVSGSDVKKGGSEIMCGSGGLIVVSFDFREGSLAAVEPLRCKPPIDESSLGVVGRVGRSCPVSLFDAIHFVFVISSRATGSTGTSGCWNATLTQPRQFRPEGMNWSTSSSNYR